MDLVQAPAAPGELLEWALRALIGQSVAGNVISWMSLEAANWPVCERTCHCLNGLGGSWWPVCGQACHCLRSSEAAASKPVAGHFCYAHVRRRSHGGNSTVGFLFRYLVDMNLAARRSIGHKYSSSCKRIIPGWWISFAKGKCTRFTFTACQCGHGLDFEGIYNSLIHPDSGMYDTASKLESDVLDRKPLT